MQTAREKLIHRYAFSDSIGWDRRTGAPHECNKYPELNAQACWLFQAKAVRAKRLVRR
jgi:hypothetical protein